MKRSEVRFRQQEIEQILRDADIDPGIPTSQIEVADFGLEHFEAEGLGIVLRVNEPEYCSKWLTLLPGQWCPWHHHKVKKETFLVFKGEVELLCEAQTITLCPGDHYTIPVGADHTFGSKLGAIVEEVSTHDENSDSYFRNTAVIRDPVVDEDE